MKNELGIVLESTILIQREYSGKSKFEFWRNLTPGDHVKIEQGLIKVGHYKPTITLTNMTDGSIHKSTSDDICNYLSKIEFVEDKGGQ